MNSPIQAGADIMKKKPVNKVDLTDYYFPTLEETADIRKLLIEMILGDADRDNFKKIIKRDLEELSLRLASEALDWAFREEGIEVSIKPFGTKTVKKESASLYIILPFNSKQNKGSFRWPEELAWEFKLKDLVSDYIENWGAIEWGDDNNLLNLKAELQDCINKVDEAIVKFDEAVASDLKQTSK